MYLKRILLKNFQGHKHTEMLLDEHINVITGSTDMGKTSIYRALYKALRDDPPGVNDFMSTWATSTLIELETSDGTILRRVINAKTTKDGERKVDSHYYEVVTNGKTETYTGFGRDIPVDVLNAIPMPILELGKESLDLHFSDQHNSYFLVKKSDGLSRVKLFSKLSHMDIFESVRGDIKTAERGNKITLNEKQKTLEALNEDIKLFSSYKQARPLIIQIKEELDTVDKIDKLLQAAQSYNNCVAEIAFLTKKVSLAQSYYSRIKAEQAELLEATERFNNLNTALIKWQQIEEKHRVVQAALSKLPTEQKLSEINTKLSQWLEKLQSIDKLEKAQDRHNKAIAALSSCTTAIKSRKDSYVAKMEEYKTLLLESKVCPICAGELTEDSIEHALSPYRMEI